MKKCRYVGVIIGRHRVIAQRHTMSAHCILRFPVVYWESA